MLLVRIGGVDGYGAAAEEVDVGHFALERGLHGRGGYAVDAVLQLGADPAAEEEGGEVASVDDFFDERVWRGEGWLVVIVGGAWVVVDEIYRSSFWRVDGGRCRSDLMKVESQSEWDGQEIDRKD